MISPPKDSNRFIWTQHIKKKMIFYSISASQIRSILRKADRTEESIVPGLFASMKKNHKKNKKEELWLMYLILENQNSKKIKLISVWRYPGITEKGKELQIPEDVLFDIVDVCNISCVSKFGF